jgi:glycogen operon protein
MELIGRLVAVRRQYPTLRCNHYMGMDEVAPGITELSWWDERGVQLSPEDWNNADGRILILRRAEKRPDGTLEVTAMMMNADAADIEFKLPGQLPWDLLYDTADPARPAAKLETDHYKMEGRTVVLLAAEIVPESP